MSVASLKKNQFGKKTENVVIKEIYTKADLQKKSKASTRDTHLDPNVNGVPVDYSFRKVFSLSELESGTPREYRVGIPKKGSSGKYISSSLWANYNHLTSLSDVDSLVNKSFHRPEMIGWLDVSFNEIEIISNELLSLKNLKILYMHGNKIRFFIEITKLKELKQLKTLTLHGNPIEDNPSYRSMVTKTLPQLVNFDFSLVTNHFYGRFEELRECPKEEIRDDSNTMTIRHN